jgi:hypothetical protein
VKNITVSVEDEIYHRARVKAAVQKSSVSKLVASYLEELANGDDGVEQARKEMAVLFEKNLGGEYKVKLTREEMHED